MLRMISQVGLMAFLIALYYGTVGALGDALISNIGTFLFADYVTFWNTHLAHRMPSLTHPVLMVIGATLLLVMLPGILNLARLVASFVIALFLVRAGFALVGSGVAPAPTSALGMAALFAVGFIIFMGTLASVSSWLRHSAD